MAYSDFYRKYPGYSGGSSIYELQPSEFVIQKLREKRNGFFVDVGAHNGIDWSNSLLLESVFDWSGIAIEGNPDIFNNLVINRKCECINAVINNDVTKQLFWSITGGASGLGGLESGFKNNHEERISHELNVHSDSICKKIEVIPRTLTEILSERNIPNIDYLSIDVEGNELGVIKSLDFNKITCTLISAESNDRVSVSNYLAQFGYKLLVKICADDFYAKET